MKCDRIIGFDELVADCDEFFKKKGHVDEQLVREGIEERFIEDDADIICYELCYAALYFSDDQARKFLFNCIYNRENDSISATYVGQIVM